MCIRDSTCTCPATRPASAATPSTAASSTGWSQGSRSCWWTGGPSPCSPPCSATASPNWPTDSSPRARAGRRRGGCCGAGACGCWRSGSATRCCCSSATSWARTGWWGSSSSGSSGARSGPCCGPPASGWPCTSSYSPRSACSPSPLPRATRPRPWPTRSRRW